jgi:hypothetical protein
MAQHPVELSRHSALGYATSDQYESLLPIAA